ncbi:unnamed protein product (macronuclear) [Paramecium tetraurelia]|uniref:Uncharacterized protein n=1 Tax=Paramecium tetraurelia TaxID=5888 RepID=A0EHW5_PARTE|nr:uncharacterized protein GSPATT00027233001 [Paramecium tetraurelia]CAK94906.1 unnamed protein product [Paramecium tetraurelia]|eukprot:XP_001462279.1 hypothetical protein (macronuclear) [Paramecium tetraurelia strain d4-2]
MDDNYRDEFQGSESEITRRSDEKQFKCIRISIAFSIYLIFQMLALRIEYQIQWTYIAIVFIICDTFIWILTTIWLFQQQYPRIAKVFLGIAQHSTFGLLPVFALLLCLQLDSIINQNSILVAFPLFTWEILLLSFLIFIIPGLSDDTQGSKKWVAVVILYYIAIIYTEIATLIQLQFHFNWFWVTSLLIFTFFYHIIILITDYTITVIWQCTILATCIFCLFEFTYILNDVSKEQNKQMQYLAIIPMCVISIINFIKQIIV